MTKVSLETCLFNDKRKYSFLSFSPFMSNKKECVLDPVFHGIMFKYSDKAHAHTGDGFKFTAAPRVGR